MAVTTSTNVSATVYAKIIETLIIAYQYDEATARGHAEALVPLLQKCLQALDGGLQSVHKIAVCVGPGSFTGLRVGLSAARALGLAAGVPVVGVTSLSAYAAPHIIAGTTLSIATLIDARHGNAYCQCVTGGGRMLIAPVRMAVSEIIEILNRSGGVKVVGDVCRNRQQPTWSFFNTVSQHPASTKNP